jgi:NAD(P)-dependent dehydrogenase (short-subunit alcohol dehydrogenase family)
MAVGMQGKIVAVTGAARGLGAEIARQLSGRGARVALIGLEPDELAAVSAQCSGSKWWEADVTDSAALDRVAAQVTDHFGRVDVLVINAGVASGGPFLHTDPKAFDRTIEVNLMGSVRTLRAFLPALVKTKGYSLQIASVAALAALPMMAAYCTSKSGVEAFTESVRTELAPHGVDLGVAYLSWTDTDMVRGADERAELAKSRSELPGVLGKTYALEPTVKALCDGIEKRAAHVYGQPWVRVIRPIRGLLAGITYGSAKRQVGQSEQAFLTDAAAGGQPGGLVGAGGRADQSRPPRLGGA